MRTVKPVFYDDFKCIAEKCTDNCCIGWEVDVDSDTAEKYEDYRGALGERLRSELTVSTDGSRCFKMRADGKCPFLNENNLCDIIAEAGDGMICEICREHPRFYEWAADVTECGLGLCCEEACRLLLNCGEFSLTVDGDEKAEDDEAEIYDSFFAFRQNLFNIITNEKTDLAECINNVLAAVKNSEFYCGESRELKSIKEIAELYKTTEPIDGNWLAYAEKIAAFAESGAGFNKADEPWLRLVFAYLLYRHLTAGLYDGDIYARACFCAEAVGYIGICAELKRTENGGLCERDIIDVIKYWSKQTEYSDLNINKAITLPGAEN